MSYSNTLERPTRLPQRQHYMEDQHMLKPREEVGPRELRCALRESKVIAVLGLHPEKTRAAYYVPEYLHRQGYTILPVNPKLLKRPAPAFGKKAYRTLHEIRQPVHIVQIFRNSEAVLEHVNDILAMRPLPRVVWMQQGVANAKAANILRSKGILVIQDRCMLADHRELL